MSAFLVIQVGQCGNQIGAALLPDILKEYEINTSKNEGSKAPKLEHKLKKQQYMSSFFNIPGSTNNSKTYNTLTDLKKHNIKARIICIDMEDSVIAQLRTGKYRDLYNAQSFITNYPGSGNNWAEGYCEHGPKYKDSILNAIKFNVEHCDNLHGFILIFASGGGTGSGLGTYVIQILADHYPGIERFVVCVYPTGTEDVITYPYNAAFATNELIMNANCVFPVENRKLMELVLKKQGKGSIRAVAPLGTFEYMNGLIVDMILHLTSGSRFSGTLNLDMNEIYTNMVPFPGLNFLSSGYSPLNSESTEMQLTSKQSLLLSACGRQNQLIKVDPLDPNEISICSALLGRGAYTINDMQCLVSRLNSKLSFVPWSKKSIKIALCDVPPSGSTNALFSLSNTTALAGLHESILEQFEKMFQRKAHVHHYTNINGFELDDFVNCRNAIETVIQKYREIGITKPLYE